MAKAPQLERQLELDLVALAAYRGGEALKIQTVGQRGFPDRLVLLPIPAEHQEIVARYVKFIELKRPGQSPRVQQEQWLRRLAKLGLSARWLADRKDVAALFEESVYAPSKG